MSLDTSTIPTGADENAPRPSLRELLRRPGPPIFIGVAGDSGSGKTTYTNGLRRMLGPDIVGTIAMDGYHKEDRAQRRRSGRLPLDPEANYLGQLRRDLEALRRGETVEIPIYNHRTGTFDPPRAVTAPPILIIEGLHALYPEFLPLLDYRIYVDPDRDIKWRWKVARDTKYRGHQVEYLTEEMLAREAAYKRWIEFQKTDANVVIKIHSSRLADLAQNEYLGEPPENCFYMELIFQPIGTPLPTMRVPFNLARALGADPNPFLFAVVPRTYWGRRATAIHLDGQMTRRNVSALEKHIVAFTGIPPIDGEERMKHERVSAIRFTQLVVLWPILEHITDLLLRRPEPVERLWV
ncbi:MAG TPA: phosphoribulokinase [Candidatus Competibacteraceae bacterium]|nr:phosphoribulokinase [Candidatus Competibacteraceae bacterium]